MVNNYFSVIKIALKSNKSNSMNGKKPKFGVFSTF